MNYQKIVDDIRKFLTQEMGTYEEVRKDRGIYSYRMFGKGTFYLPIEIEEGIDYSYELSHFLVNILFKTPNFWMKGLTSGENLDNLHMWAKKLHKHLHDLSLRDPDGYFNNYVLFRKKD